MLRQIKLGPVPKDTAQASRAFRRKPNVYIKFADLFASRFDVSDFSNNYSNFGQSAIHPVRLLLLLMVAYLEGLSDRQVMEALAARIDLKYLLALPLDHEGYDFSVLSEMRGRLIEGNLEALLFNKMLAFAEDHGLLKTATQRTDSTTILSAARRLSRLELVIETLTHALDVLSEIVPELVISVAQSFEQLRAYEVSTFQFRLPKKDKDQTQLAESVGRDGFRLLNAIDRASESTVLNKIPAVKTLRSVWEQQFDDSDANKGPRFRKHEELRPSAELIGSPHDLDARYTAKRNEIKFGYSTHVTETCTDGAPRLITNVCTTPATVSDSNAIHSIERSLRAHGLKPDEHLVDAGYTKAEWMSKSREQYDTEIIGPLKGGNNWQASAGKGFDLSRFIIDWETKQAICPQGNTSKSWRERPSRGSAEISFDSKDCSKCPVRSDCTKSDVDPRKLELKTQSLQTFLVAQREYQSSSEFKKRYAKRAGIEGTMSRYHDNGADRSPYMGLEKTHFRNVMIAGAINAVRIIRHLLQVPLAGTRNRRFSRLMAAVA